MAGPASGDAIYSYQGLINALIDANSFVNRAVAAVDLSRVNPPAQSNLIITNNTIITCVRPFIILNTISTVIANNTISCASSAAHAAFHGRSASELHEVTYFKLYIPVVIKA